MLIKYRYDRYSMGHMALFRFLKFFGFYLLTFNYMQLKIVVLSGGSKKWCFDRLESDMMIFCEWLMEGVKSYIHMHLLLSLFIRRCFSCSHFLFSSKSFCIALSLNPRLGLSANLTVSPPGFYI